MKNFLIYWVMQMFLIANMLPGCRDRINGYSAASSFSRSGFAKNEDWVLNNQGQEIMVWGYVDHHNLYGDKSAKNILDEWWGGYPSASGTWRFDLKANANDKPGQSFSVQIPNDSGRDEILKVFVADAKAQRPTKVFLKGKLFAFDAPVNTRSYTGIFMELKSSQSIRFDAGSE